MQPGGAIPAWNAPTNAQANLQNDINRVAPLATQYHGAQTGVQIQQITPQVSKSGPGVLSAFGHFLGGVASESGHLLEAGAKWLGHTAVDMVEAPVKLGSGLAHMGLDSYDTFINQSQTNELNARLTTIMSQYKSGQLSTNEYRKELASYQEDNKNLNSSIQDNIKSLSKDGSTTASAGINTASDIVTILTGGLSAPVTDIGSKAAADFLSSNLVSAAMAPAEEAIAKIAANKAVFDALPEATQRAVSASFTQTVTNASSTLTSSQVARTVATNALLKYPLAYSALAGTGQQVYQELQNDKYGEAVKSMAFNAALLLSGGPIGQAFKYGGKALQGISERTFGNTSFLDELSKRIGSSEADGLFNAVKDDPAAVKAFQALEATNMQAAGNKPATAAFRVLDGLAQSWGDMSNMSHQDFVKQVMNWHDAQVLVDQFGKTAGKTGITVGRWTKFDSDRVAKALVTDDESAPIATQTAEPTPTGDTPTQTTTEPATEPTTQSTAQPTQLPRNLRGAKPNYSYGSSRFTLNFPDDVTKSLYIVAQKSPSRADEQYMSFLHDALPGKSDAELRKMGADIKAGIKEEARTSTEDSITVKPHADATQPVSGQTVTPTKTTPKVAPKSTPTSTQTPTVGQVTGASSKENLLSRWDSLKANNQNTSWANNENLDKQIKGIIERNWDKPDAMKTAITSISAQFGEKGIPKALSDKLGKMGYVIIKPTVLEAPFKEGSGPLKSAFATSEDTSFIKTVKPLPVMESIGGQLVTMGLSPTAAPQRVYQVFNANFAEELAKTSLTYKGLAGEDLKDQADTVSRQLANFVHNMPSNLKSPPVTDYRQLTTGEISKALNISTSDAKQVSDAIMNAMLKVPVSVKGLGNKLLDLNYKLPLTGTYLRYQGALRYAWNPVFKMKLAAKGEFLSQIESKGQIPTITGMNGVLKVIFPDQYARLPSIESKLKSRNMFESGYSAEGADETAAGYKSLSQSNNMVDKSGLVASQRRAVSALVGTMADKAGLAPEDFIDQFPQETRDAIQTIVHYDPRSQLLNSPLVRTLNFVFFPARFNLKVSQIIARNLASQGAVTQFAVIKGLMNTSNFLQSDAGQAWYSQNSDVIGLFKYFSPVATISEVAQALGKKPESVSQYGELGGLPFGWIPAVLSSQGFIDYNQAYVNPKTGVVAKDYVPVTMRGRAESAIEDFIGQLFTYPGTTVGLPSKTSITANVAKGLTGGQYSDFQTTTPTNLTPSQQKFQQVVQRTNGTLHTAKTIETQPVQTQPVQVPEQPTSLTVPQPAKTGTAKKKKGDFAPQLLPGQSALGV